MLASAKSIDSTVDAFGFMIKYFPFDGGEPFYVEGGSYYAQEKAKQDEMILSLGQLVRRNGHVLIIQNPRCDAESGFYTDWKIFNHLGKSLISGSCDYVSGLKKTIFGFYAA